MLITEERIKELAGPGVYLRGKGYFLNGMVKEYSANDGLLTGRVQGSRASAYKVRIYLDKDGIRPECSCPYDWGAFCKHSVALLLTWLGAQDKEDTNDAGSYTRKEIIRNNSLVVQNNFAFLKTCSVETPRIQIWLSLESFISSKGIKIRLVIAHQGKNLEVHNLEELVNGNSRGLYNYSLPKLFEFSVIQQHFLRILNSFLQNYYYAAEMRLRQFQLSLLLNEIKNEQGIEFFERRGKQQIEICYDKIIPLQFILGLTKNNNLKVRMNLLDPDNKAIKPYGSTIIEGRPMWYFDEINLRLLPFSHRIKKELLLNCLYTEENTLNYRQIPYFLASLSDLNGCCEVIYTDEKLKTAKIEKAQPKIQAYFDYEDKKVVLDLKFIYSERAISALELNQSEEFYPINNNSGFSWIRRDLTAEKDVLKFILEECKFSIYAKTGRFYLEEPDSIFRLLFEKLPELQKRCEIFYSESFKRINKTDIAFLPEVNAKSGGIDWFYLDIKYYAKGLKERIPHSEIRRQLLGGKRYILLRTGEFIPISKQAFEKVEETVSEYEDVSKGLPLFHMPFLMDKFKDESFVHFDKSLQDFHTRVMNYNFKQKVDMPVLLRNTLRDYQKAGVKWFSFLRHFHFGGILADEMGLGKTLQILTMIQREKEQGINKPSLVICPTTLVWNWQAEARKFIPNLKVLIISGQDRRKEIANIEGVDLVITSYALLRRDIMFYKDKDFHYLILDEAQNIKNRHTLNARMSKQLKSQYRLVLTGTPIENSIADIWSIFDFLMPSFLSKYERFKERYEQPILKDNDKTGLQRLAKKIDPFILRRLKVDVAKELPKKIEQVSYAELAPTQLHAYEEMLKIGKEKVISAFKKDGFERSRMTILTVLLRLRQICCHPALAGVNLGRHFSNSAKLMLLKELVSEAIDAGHKIIIFSQFVQMLEIIAEYLRKDGVVYEYMDGSTRDRQEPVLRFNNDDAVKVFLLSLKVGGFGLNLTAADTVILYEPWWNPAVEEQAIDRAHRIGQQKTVLAYKMITKGTIEEKILELQKQKKRIFDSLIVSEDGIAKKLNWEDIKFLLDIA